MSAHFDVEQDNAHFLRVSRRVIMMFTVLICIYITASTYAILINNPSYIHDWRDVTCIVLTILIFLIYVIHFHMSPHMAWPPKIYYAVSLWVSLYLAVMWLTCINPAFVWDFYVVYALGFGLFGRARLLFSVSIIALTMFAFEGLLIWPPTGDVLVSIASQILMLFSLTGSNLLFQHLVKERFERNKIFKQLAQTNVELEDAHRQLAQSVVQEQELAILRERTRLAREMHDTIGHALVLISVKLEAAQRLRERDPERCDREIESTKQVARETMTALRASIAGLRSPILEHIDINRALSRSARELAQRTGLSVIYTPQPDIDFLPDAIEETLWKVCQEAFTNIEKHARAQHVLVHIQRQDEKLQMQIHDDGIGLPFALNQRTEDDHFVSSGPNDCYGLRGMFERVEAIGGHLTLHSDKDQGTTIDVELPLSRVVRVRPPDTWHHQEER